MIKTGNASCALLDEMVKMATSAPAAPKHDGLAFNILRSLRAKEQPSLASILAQVMPPAADADVQPPGPGQADMPQEDGVDEEAVGHLVDALISLCGSPEEAKRRIDEKAQASGPADGMPDIDDGLSPMPMTPEAPATT